MNVALRIVRLMRAVPGAQSAVWKLRKNFYALERRLLVGRPVIDGAPVIKRALSGGAAFAAGKMGSVEASALRVWMKRGQAMKEGRAPPAYPAYNMHTLHVNAGVYPQNAEIYDRFCAAYAEAAGECDALAAWDVAGEARIFAAYCPRAAFIRLRDLEPYFSADPWSRALEGKRVLVVSPFASSVARQYARRGEIWGARHILPDFTLLTLRAPLSAALAAPDAPDWFAALDKMKAQMDAADYDVALIGAGAFSLPLAAHAKKRGKAGIHLGGSLQILFGIAGQRWRKHKDFRPFFNEAWASPSAEETPQNYKMTEGGCYW